MIVNEEVNRQTGQVTVTRITAEQVIVTVDGDVVEIREPTAAELTSLNPEPTPDPVAALAAQVAELTAALEVLTRES